MKKIFYLSLVCIFTIACCPVEIQTSNSRSTTSVATPSVTKRVQISSIEIDVKGVYSVLYQFELDGHVYICNYGNDYILHSPSCSCHDSNQLFNSNSQASGLSLFDNY